MRERLPEDRSRAARWQRSCRALMRMLCARATGASPRSESAAVLQKKQSIGFVQLVRASFFRVTPQGVVKDIGRDVARLICLPVICVMLIDPVVFELSRRRIVFRSSVIGIR